MGCCLGTTKSPTLPPHHRPNGPNSRHFQATSSVPEPEPTHIRKPQVRSLLQRPPPLSRPPIVEEETVKEVLSETPISKPRAAKITQDQNTRLPPKVHEELVHSPPQVREKLTHLPPKLREELTHLPPELQDGLTHLPPELPDGLTHLPPELRAEQPKELLVSLEASQASEPCAVSESYSYSTTTTTTTIADSKEDEATSKRQREVGPKVNGSSSAAARRKRPYSGELSARRDRGPKLPARASEPSMGKRNRTETSSSRGRESGQMKTMQRGPVPTGVRRDTVSSRSRSPATRSVGGVGRGGRGRSPAKVSGPAGASSSKPLGAAAESKVEENEGKIKKEEESNDGVSKQGNESLELECFIFV